MHLPLAHLSGFAEDPSEELEAQLQATHSGSAHSHDDDEGSHSQSQSQGSGKEANKDGASGDGCRAPKAAGGKPPKDLPCPRCQSLNTKFCYYNNYSVNQPRHFCRNCQRYWTVGGTLRNVPVGGGSRKQSSRSRRSDPYCRPGSPATGSDEGHDEGDARHGQNPMMAAIERRCGPILHPDGVLGDAGYPDFPFHPSQLLSFLQLALQPSPGVGLPFPPFLDPGFAMTVEEEAELRAVNYEASTATQSGMVNAAAMMGSGMWVPELEPAHVELMHKAAMWAEAQRLQSMARRAQAQAQAVAWADQERECKPVSNMSSPPILPQRSPAMEDISLRHAHADSSYRRPGFWETALMHSRPSKRPAGASPTSQPWELLDPNRLGASVNPPVDAEPGASPRAISGAAFSQAGFDVEANSSWAPSALHSSNPDMLY